MVKIKLKQPGPFTLGDSLMFGCDIYINAATILSQNRLTIFLHLFNFMVFDIEIPIIKKYHNLKRIFHFDLTKVWDDPEYLDIHLDILCKEIFNRSYYIYKQCSKNI